MTVDLRTVVAVAVLAVAGFYALAFFLAWGFSSDIPERLLIGAFWLAAFGAIGWSVWWLV